MQSVTEVIHYPDCRYFNKSIFRWEPAIEKFDWGIDWERIYAQGDKQAEIKGVIKNYSDLQFNMTEEFMYNQRMTTSFVYKILEMTPAK